MHREDTIKSEKSTTTRRRFLVQTGAVLAGASTLTGLEAAQKPSARMAGRVLGANDRINLAFIGTGMQWQGLLRGFQARKERLGDVEFVACCDVWEARLKNAQEKTKAEKTYRDYREILQRPDVDGVVVAVPDHWHFAIARDACLAGKDVYLEKPMTRTIEQAAQLNDIVDQTKRILQVGGSGPASGLNWRINEYIKAGKMGKILWGLISYNRNTDTGMWDYPIPGIGETPWPDAQFNEKTCDWNMWLGSTRKRPFSAERYFRWRKFWDYATGNAGDLLYHQLGTMSTMIGFDFPAQAVAAGGIYIQKDREVPDTYMTMVEYPGEYCVNMVSCMGNAESVPITVYGNWGTLRLGGPGAAAGQSQGAMGDPGRAGTQPPAPAPGGRPGGGARRRAVATITAEPQFVNQFKEANDGKNEVTIESPEQSESLGENWLNCMRTRQSPVYNVLRGYQVLVAIMLGVDSYREGKALAYDPVGRKVLPRPPARKVYPPAET
jgi:predicted dehydrogenase